jgi:small subunit ribosomal protein S20
LTTVVSIFKMRGSFLGVLRVANTKSAEKAARQSAVHRVRNDALTSQLRSAIRKATLALKAGKQDDATAALAHATPIIDSMVNKGIIHRNKAARHKSRLTRQVRAMSAVN